MTKKNNSKKQNINVFAKQNKNVTKVSKSISGIKGLTNLGNTCYFNSMLQMIFHSPLFLNELKEHCSSDQTITAILGCDEYKLIQQKTDISAVEKELLNILESDGQTVSPNNLRCVLLQNKDFKAHFSGLNEQDSHEVFLMVLNIIKDAQIKRIRASILDYFNCRKSQLSVDDDTKKKIKDISTIIEKQNLINNYFGIVIGSNFKCQNCNELRMRFDEVFHISPVFPEKNDLFDNDIISLKNSEPDHVIIKSHNEIPQTEKLSKHQLKRQKRIEKKIIRNKKSIQRNAQCSSEDLERIDQNQVTVDVEIINATDDKEDEETVDVTENIVEELVENVDYSNIVGGHHDGFNDTNQDDIIEESFEMQQLLYDAITIDSQLVKDDKSSRSSDDSMIVRKNNSSRGSLVSLTSLSDVEILTETALCEQFNRDILLEDQSLENVFTDDKTVVLDNIILPNSENLDENDNMESPTKNSIVDNDINVSCTMTLGEDDLVKEENINNAVVHNSLDGDKGDVSLNRLYSSTLETYQDYLYSINQHKTSFEAETDLDKALKRFNSPLFLENIVCDNCSKTDRKVKTDHLKTDIICHLPQILPFYISRFKQSIARNRNKNTTVYSYPFILNLSSQCSKYVNFSSNKSPVLYRIFGIIEHIGSRINTGHYVSYVSRRITESDSTQTCEYSSKYPVNIFSELRTKHEENLYSYNDYEWFQEQDQENVSKAEEPSNYQWFRISDSHVEAVSNEGVMNIQAFMLFYSRIQ